MPCSVSIATVIGIPSPGGTATSSVRVSGTLSGDCEPVPHPQTGNEIDIIVTVYCSGGGVANGFALSAEDEGDQRNWSTNVVLDCVCGEQITVAAYCARDPECRDTFGGRLECRSDCPTGTVRVDYGDCDPGGTGTRNVTLTAEIDSLASGSIVVGQWNFGDGTPTTAFPITATGALPPQVHSYAPPGPFTASLIFVLPENCPPLAAVISNIEDCPVDSCPETTDIRVDAADDCIDGRRRVTLSAQTVGPAPQRYRWELGVPGVVAVETTTPEVTFDYPAPGDGMVSYQVTLAIVGPNDCIDTFTREFSIAGCAGDCPILESITVTPGDCTEDFRQRTIHLDAEISGGGGTEYEWSFGDGSANQPIVGSSPSTSHLYLAAASYTVSLTMRGPESCPDRTVTRQVEVQGCVVGRPDEDSVGCAVLLVLSILFMSAGVGLLIAGICSGLAYLTIAGAAALAFGLLLFALWHLICGRSTSCSLMQRVFCYLGILITGGIIAGALIAILGDVTCGLATVASSGWWGLIMFWLGRIMRRNGCEPSFCGR